jgi:hypothetical protein
MITYVPTTMKEWNMKGYAHKRKEILRNLWNGTHATLRVLRTQAVISNLIYFWEI